MMQIMDYLRCCCCHIAKGISSSSPVPFCPCRPSTDCGRRPLARGTELCALDALRSFPFAGGNPAVAESERPGIRLTPPRTKFSWEELGLYRPALVSCLLRACGGGDRDLRGPGPGGGGEEC